MQVKALTMRFFNWFKGFFEKDTPQSMTRLLTFKIGCSGVVYLFITLDFAGAIAIFTSAGAVKITGKKLTEPTESKK